MQRLIPSLFPLLLLTVLVGCSGFEDRMYEAAINREIRNADMEEKEVELNGLTMSYLESRGDRADREVVVLIHGFSANNHNWLRLAQALEDDYHLILPDLPGHGKSTQSKDADYSIPAQVEALNRFMAAIEVDEFHVGGNSMGGAIAAMYAASFPDQILSAALMNPAGVHEHPSEMDRMMSDTDENPLIVREPADFDPLLDFIMEERPFLPWPISSAMARRAAGNQEINRKIFDDIRTDDMEGQMAEFREQLERIEAPTLVLWGREDRVIHVDNAAVFEERIPDARVVILDDIGHVPMMEDTERTASELRDIMTKGRERRDAR